MSERIAIVEGVRTPFCKSGGVFRDIDVDDLGAVVVNEVLSRSKVKGDQIDEMIFGNVLQPANATNVARIIAVKGNLPIEVPAFTVNRNCASGMEAVVTGAEKIRLGDAKIVLAGGAESMSNFPVLFKKKMKNFLVALSKAKNWKQKLSVLATLRPSFFAPEVPEISDPLCGLNMGQTAEILARDFKITRREQDEFALRSQERAYKAQQENRFKDEIVPVFLPSKYEKAQEIDDGVRPNQTIKDFEKLKPAFDKLTGTVTAGTSSQTTDGAVALILMSESKAKELGIKPLGFIKEAAVAGLAPNRMGLGPAFAISKLLKKTGQQLSDFDLVEINEAFAGQVLASVKALASDEFAKAHLDREKAVGQIDFEKLNVNGGAVALGHPLGASGARLILTILKELKRRNKKLGLAALCVGGGQGQAVIVEANNE